MNIYLSGGGSSEQTIALDELYFGSLAEESRIAYIPVALRGKRTFDECTHWFHELASKYGQFRVSVFENLSNDKSYLQECDAVYIGGGNTYELLREVRQSRFQIPLLEFAHAGKPIYGGSAGAVILGKDIQTIRYMDTDNHSTENTSGLDFVSGYSVWPHYDSSQDQKILEYVTETSIPVLAISEDSGVCVKPKLEAVGRVWVFDEFGRRLFA